MSEPGRRQPPLGPDAWVTGVDPSTTLLAAFIERAERLEISSSTVDGVWPDTAARTGIADVVVCRHVFYNVTDLAAFAGAPTDHAGHRVIVELTAEHPRKWLAP